MMKKIQFIVLLLMMVNCKAQNTLIPIYENDDLFVHPNAYYYDSESEFDKFVGTWKWEEGLSSITITLQKKSHVFIPDRGSFVDLLVGEYSFVDATGTVIINTLPQLENTTIEPYNRNIWGHDIFRARPGNPLTPNNASTLTEYHRIQLNFQDPDRTYQMSVIKMRYIDTPIPKIEVSIGGRGMQILEDGQNPEIRIPDGFFTLVKQ